VTDSSATTRYTDSLRADKGAVDVLEPNRSICGLRPHGTMLMADLGADVVRIDRPGESAPPGDPRANVIGRGKRSVALDLKDPEHLELARRLVDRWCVLG
jgi:crotonobetainyl-CoA:carnitine CoA-transferase CaiB-like acyl-CoA transferase